VLEVSVPIAHELLEQCIKQGRALVQRASLVGDFTDYEAWKGARKQWIDPTVHALEHMYGNTREAGEFTNAVACPEAGKRWQQQYAADLDCVKCAIELLAALQRELAFDAPLSFEHATEARRHVEQAPASDAPEFDVAPTAVTSALAPTPARASEEAERDEAIGAELTRSPSHFGSELAQHHETPATPGEHDSTQEGSPTRTRRVFLAHGRDERWKDAVAHLLERAGAEEVTILNDQPEQRAELLEHIGERAANSRYAIVLLTADDIGAARLESAEEPYFTTRARQGLVFEMGFLVAALTPGRVCVLYEDGVELPCELDGISHVRLDLAGTWQPKLLLALRRAGFDYDLNRLAA
jgi:predicted nucleotide-binding protein